MVCTLEELRSKDVINVVNGENLGRIDDLQMNAQTASVTALILYGRPRLWGIFGPRDNCIIDFRQIRLVGKDVILVELGKICTCLLYTSPSPRDVEESRMPSSA